MKKLILIMLVLILISGCKHKEINPNDLSINPEIINNLQYEIHIDCEWVNLHTAECTTINELCEEVFPKLYNKSTQ